MITVIRFSKNLRVHDNGLESGLSREDPSNVDLSVWKLLPIQYIGAGQLDVAELECTHVLSFRNSASETLDGELEVNRHMASILFTLVNTSPVEPCCIHFSMSSYTVR